MRRITVCLLTRAICCGQQCGGVPSDGSGGSGGSGGSNSGGGTGPNPDNAVVIFDNSNIYEVTSNPIAPAQFTTDRPYTISFVETLHWNDGKGTTKAGTISLRSTAGVTYGPWQTTGKAGTSGAPNVYWQCSPNIALPAGTYTVVDSEPATWSWNAASGSAGICLIEGIPSVTPGDITGEASTPAIDMWTELAKRPYITVHFDDGYADSPAEGPRHSEEWRARITWSSRFFATAQRINGCDIIGTLSADGTSAVTIQATDQSAATQGAERWIILKDIPYVQGPEPGDLSGKPGMVFAVNGVGAKSHVALSFSAIENGERWLVTEADIVTWYKSHVWVRFSATP